MPVSREEPLMMIIRYHKQRTSAHTATSQFRDNCVCDLLSRRSDIMQRDDDKILRGVGRCNEWKELRCRNRTHSGIFGLSAALNKAKGIKERQSLSAASSVASGVLSGKIQRAINFTQRFAETAHTTALTSAHLHNFAKRLLRQSHHRQTRLPNQRNSFQSRIGFDLTERNSSSQWFDRCKINRRPIAFSRRRISIGR